MSEISSALKELAEKLDQAESEVVAANKHLSDSEERLALELAKLDPMRDQIESAKKQVWDANMRKSALLAQIGDLVRAGDAPNPDTLSRVFDASTLPILSLPVETLELARRTKNVFAAEDIHFIGDLVKLPSDFPAKGFGQKSRNETKGVLSRHGLRFGMKLINWPPPDLKQP
jgi:DNA-directed RNA polymerase alpha subunit